MKFKITDHNGDLVAELSAPSWIAAEQFVCEQLDMFLIEFYAEYNLIQVN
ncbi:hypothetical protein OMDBNIEC_00052 [Salmonella phage STP-SP5]|nr:hypothetical protein OMDBNIEC_00052 [Salmonella phage STP-SP5]